jgi:hypothetical protein
VNNIDKNDINNFYKKFNNYETKLPTINFQTRLSKISTTFSFDRPTDLLNHNLYSNLYSNRKHKNIYIASLQDLTIKKYSVFLHNLLQYHNIQPPYIIICMSEGGYDALCFSKFYPQLVKKIYFIDTPLLENFMQLYEEFRGNTKWDQDVKNKLFSWKMNSNDINNFSTLDKETLGKIDIYNFEIKTHNIVQKLKINDFSKKIPIVILWSPYYDSPTNVSKKKKNIIEQMNKQLDKFSNINYFFVNAPHQIERVIPITLSNFIINTLV